MPGDYTTWAVLGAAYLERARITADPSFHQKAEREWQRREFADVADTLARALHLNGRDAEALEYARRAGALGARNAQYAYHIGMIELSLGDRAAAREQLSRALDLDPHFSPWDAPIAARTLANLES